MAKKIINVGTSVNKGNGDPLRTAFQKINDNFDELYSATTLDLDSIGSNMVPTTDGGFALGSATKQWSDVYVRDFIYLGNARLQADADGNLVVNGASIKVDADVTGTIFADDSTLLVDGVNAKIVGPTEPSSFKAPMLTQAQVDALTPEEGLMVYNTTTGKFQGYAADANNDSVAG
jgi:hypothetical protein